MRLRLTRPTKSFLGRVCHTVALSLVFANQRPLQGTEGVAFCETMLSYVQTLEHLGVDALSTEILVVKGDRVTPPTRTFELLVFHDDLFHADDRFRYM